MSTDNSLPVLTTGPAPVLQPMFYPNGGGLTKPWRIWFEQLFQSTVVLTSIQQNVTDGTLASAFDDRNPVSYAQAIQDALMQAQPDTPHDVYAILDDALQQTRPATARDFTQAIEDAYLKTAADNPAPQVTREEVEDLRRTIAHSDIVQPRSFLYDGYGNPISSNSGALDVYVTNGGGGVSVTDESAWTAGTSPFAPTGGVYNDSATALTSGQQGQTRSTANRGLHVNLRNSSGTEIATAGNPISVSDALLEALISSGSLKVSVQNGSLVVTEANLDNTIAATGAVVPSKTLQIGGSDGTDLRTLLTDTSGQAKVLVENFPATQPVSGSVTVSGTVADSTMAAVITSSKVQVQDVAIENLIANSRLNVNSMMPLSYANVGISSWTLGTAVTIFTATAYYVILAYKISLRADSYASTAGSINCSLQDSSLGSTNSVAHLFGMGSTAVTFSAPIYSPTGVNPPGFAFSNTTSGSSFQYQIASAQSIAALTAGSLSIEVWYRLLATQLS